MGVQARERQIHKSKNKLFSKTPCLSHSLRPSVYSLVPEAGDSDSWYPRRGFSLKEPKTGCKEPEPGNLNSRDGLGRQREPGQDSGMEVGSGWTPGEGANAGGRRWKQFPR